jgi:hypothetical protein
VAKVATQLTLVADCRAGSGGSSRAVAPIVTTKIVVKGDGKA